MLDWILGFLPANDTGEFISGALISTGMVTADAFFWQLAAIPLLVIIGKFNLPKVLLVSTMIAVAHQVYGMLGLGVRAIGGPFEAVALPFILVGVTYLVFGFVLNGSIGNGEDAAEKQSRRIIKYGIVSLAAFFGVYTGVSIDEMFAVLGRVEWMSAQGWSHLVMLANITVAMAMLWVILMLEGALLYSLTKAAEHTKPMEWLEAHEDWVMFLVFSLLVYFVVRGWYQNVAGYSPAEWHIGDFNTGFAHNVYFVGGLAPMLVLLGLLRVDRCKAVLKAVFKPQKDLIDWLEDWSERRAQGIAA